LENNDILDNTFLVYLPTHHADSIKTPLQYVTHIHNFCIDTQYVERRHYIQQICETSRQHAGVRY